MKKASFIFVFIYTFYLMLLPIRVMAGGPPPTQNGTCDQYHPGVGGQFCVNNGAASGWYNMSGDVQNTYNTLHCSPTDASQCGQITVNALHFGGSSGTQLPMGNTAPTNGQVLCNNNGVVGGCTGGGGGGSGTVNAGQTGNVPEYVGGGSSTTIGDTGVAWPPRLDQLSAPAQGDYSMGNFFAPLQLGTYYQIGAPLVFGSQGEQLTGISSPRLIQSNPCLVENDGTSTIATVSSDAGGKYITLSSPLTGTPDAGTSLQDTTSGTITAIVNPTTGNNTTSKLYFASTTGFSTSDSVSTGTSAVCVTPSLTQAYQGLVFTLGLDQTESSFTIPANLVSGPFLPAVEANKQLGAWFLPITATAAATYTFSWPTAANGGMIITNVSNVNLGTPFEANVSGGLFGTTNSTTSIGFGAVTNSQVSDLFLTFSLQGTGNTQTLPVAPTEGKGIIEDVLYTNNNAPATACQNTAQNAFGYIPPYNNVLFTDPQWGGTYQRMIRPGPGGNVDHNFYYNRNSWNANHTLMAGLLTPPSANGTGSPWVMALFDQNGCFLYPMYTAVGAVGTQPQFNWRMWWSPTDPNVFYTGGAGTQGKLPGVGTLTVNTLYAMHPCATAITGHTDAACTTDGTLTVAPMAVFSNALASGSNFISTNEPTGPSVSEDGSRIGIVTRPSSNSSGDYYWSSFALTNSTTVNLASLHTYDITTGVPSGYCHSAGEVEKDRYIGNRDLIQAAVYRGTGTPACSVGAFDAGMQLIDDSLASPAQYSFIAQDINAPWFNGGGHETYSPSNSAPGGGYFCYAHVDGGSNFGLSACTASGNVATCTASGGLNFPAWPIGTVITGRNISVSGYNVTGATTTGGGGPTISYQLASTPGSATGGTLFDGNQWENHCIGLNGTGDVTTLEGANLLSAQTDHQFWPWGSSLNGGSVQDFYYSGFAYNGLSNYPTTAITSCTYTGSAPTGTAVCNIAALPSAWITPTANHAMGSLGASTPYVSGVSDGVDQCYNGVFPITASTSTSFSFKPTCTPAGSGTGGSAYVGPTDEIYQCYVGDATFGTGCRPIARTYTAQVTSDFYFEPLPNGDQEGDLVEFDSAPGVVPVSSFGKYTDSATLAPTSTASYNPSLFYTYAAISPSGTLQSNHAAPWSGVTLALEGAPASAPVVTLTSNGDQSINGGRMTVVAPPGAMGDAEVEGQCVGCVASTPLVNGCKADITLSSGTGTFTNSCITATSACFATDVTSPSSACHVAAPTAGSVAVTGTGTDDCRTVCQ